MSVVRRWSLLVALAGAVGVVAPPELSGQFFSFGQNKIQYRKLDWRILRGPHVDLYYYPVEAELAPAALAYAEASYDTLAVQFSHDVAKRIPLVVYASHTDFQQTNILPFTPPEACWAPPTSSSAASRCRSGATSPSSATPSGTSWCTCSSWTC
jgi:hypothetical protein